MPISEARARHLLRRTEFVDRQARVDEMIAMADIEAAVDDVLDSTLSGYEDLDLGSGETWQLGQNMTRDWLDRMATSSSPFRERMAFFWHGHLCSDLEKVRDADFMAEQIDLYRRDGVNGVFGQMLKDMSLQVAMLRYLDNDRNIAESPNQNFARELKELFVLGVGNYTEADVEAATAAWTGHTAHWETGAYDFVNELHEIAPQQFLGQTINQGSKPFKDAGFETIDVLLGLGDHTSVSTRGKVTVGPNAPADAREVAAAFLSKKLWQEFGEANSGDVPAGVKAAMVAALLDNDFAIRPWIRAMLVHDDFYPDTNAAVAGALVRQPVEYMVALMVASGGSASEVAALWLMGQAGQELLYPPNVSGWRPNGYWVNPSAFEARSQIAQGVVWGKLDDHYWTHPWDQRYLNYFDLPGGRIYADEIVGPHWDLDPNNPGAPWHPRLSNEDLVDKILDYMDLHFSDDSIQALVGYCNSLTAGSDPNWGERWQVPLLVIIAPEMHIN